MQVPFVSLKIDQAELRSEITQGIEAVVASNAFAGGPFVSAFETDFASFCGADFAVGVGSGTDALWLTLLALGVGPGDEVITVPNTFIATVEAISMCGARPVFIDVEDRTQTMDPGLLEPAITPKTKAVIPVHLYGQTADMDPILEVARRHRLPVVEDACQAHGATYKGRMAGSLGDAACFSFYPTKNLGAFGEAGAVVTNDKALKDRIVCLRDHGQVARYHHEVVGWNGRMDGIQGAVLKAKLKHLAQKNEQRRGVAAFYAERLAGVPGLILPWEAPHARHVYHLYVVRVEGDRTAFMAHLGSKGIGCLIHYPVPVHLQKAYRFLGLVPGTFPRAEAAAQKIVSLPMFPELTSDQLELVVKEIQGFLGKKAESCNGA